MRRNRNRRHTGRLSVQDVADMLSMRIAGLSLSAIGEATHTTKQAAHQTLRRAQHVLAGCAQAAADRALAKRGQ